MDVSAAGQAFLLAAIACALWFAGTSADGVKRNDNRLAASGERSLFATGFFHRLRHNPAGLRLFCPRRPGPPGDRPAGYSKGLVTVISGNPAALRRLHRPLGVVLIRPGISGTAFRESWSGTRAPGGAFMALGMIVILSRKPPEQRKTATSTGRAKESVPVPV